MSKITDIQTRLMNDLVTLGAECELHVHCTRAQASQDLIRLRGQSDLEDAYLMSPLKARLHSFANKAASLLESTIKQITAQLVDQEVGVVIKALSSTKEEGFTLGYSEGAEDLKHAIISQEGASVDNYFSVGIKFIYTRKFDHENR